MSEGIAWQNKDILLKILSESYKNKTLSVYGLNLPPIKEMLPANLPALQLNERRADNIFLLEDNTILILEYESDDDNQAILKYGHYAFRVAETYFKEKLRRVIIAVIYTGDIEKAPAFLDLGCIKLSLEQVFLSKLNGNEIYNQLKNKIDNKELLSDEDVMSLVILPLTQKNNKQEFIKRTVNLAREITDETIQKFAIAGILVAADKFIDKNYSDEIKELLAMTKIDRLYEEEKIEYAQKYAKEREQERAKEIARNLLSDGVDIITIMKATTLSKAEIANIKNTLVNA